MRGVKLGQNSCSNGREMNKKFKFIHLNSSGLMALEAFQRIRAYLISYINFEGDEGLNKDILLEYF